MAEADVDQRGGRVDLPELPHDIPRRTARRRRLDQHVHGLNHPGTRVVSIEFVLSSQVIGVAGGRSPRPTAYRSGGAYSASPVTKFSIRKCFCGSSLPVSSWVEP